MCAYVCVYVYLCVYFCVYVCLCVCVCVCVYVQQVLQRLVGHKQAVYNISAQPSHSFATAGFDGVVQLWTAQ